MAYIDKENESSLIKNLVIVDSFQAVLLNCQNIATMVYVDPPYGHETLLGKD